jgi:hypothetical protein
MSPVRIRCRIRHQLRFIPMPCCFWKEIGKQN